MRISDGSSDVCSSDLLRFSAVPLTDLALEESDGSGRLDTAFRRQLLGLDRIAQLYPAVTAQSWFADRRPRRDQAGGPSGSAADDRIAEIDCIWPPMRPGGGWAYAPLPHPGLAPGRHGNP